MIGIDEAQRLIEQQTHRLPSESRALAEALRLVLNQDVASGMDSPPHDKAQVDGYAVRCEDLASGDDVVLRVIEEITAGEVPTQPLTAGTAARIMTGAPVPPSADAVVMVERTEAIATAVDGDEQVRILDRPRAGQNILRRGTAFQRGERVLVSGHVLGGAEIGLLAELGVTHVQAVRQPVVAVLATGNELVPFDMSPAEGQIRNSNGPMLAALVGLSGAIANPLGIAVDTRDDLRSKIAAGLHADVLLLSGGVSAGILDLVPSVLQELGVREVFHKVSLKPGKPLWFGVKVQPEPRCLVFGLPGNPVSSLVSFELFVRPVLARLAGAPVRNLESNAKLTKSFVHRGERTTYFPGKLRDEAGELCVEPLPWRGSADLKTLTQADVLIAFGPGDYELAAGEVVRVRHQSR